MLTRNVSLGEFVAIAKGKIPIFDELFDFKYGKAVFVKNGRSGVINKKYEILLDGIYSEIKFLKNGCIMAKSENSYLLFDRRCYRIRTKGFKNEEEAVSYSRFF